MIKNNKIGFLFDLDGVIIDSESEYSRIWKQVNKEYPTGLKSLETVIKGCTLDKILNDHYPDLEIREKVVARLYELESKMEYKYLNGADKFINELISRELPIALVTSSNNVKMAHLREELPELMDKFDFIVTADLISRSKPDPEGYLLGASKLNISPSKCVVFEDSLQGVKAGKNSGSFVVGVYGTLKPSDISPYCDMIVGGLNEVNLDELIEIISKR